MSKKQRMIEGQVVDPSGKIITVSVIAAKQNPHQASAAGIPSAVGIASAADNEMSAEVADDLSVGIGTAPDDELRVRFSATPSVRVPPFAQFTARISELLGGSIEVDDAGVTWTHAFTHDGEEVNLFESSAALSEIVGLQADAVGSGIRFVIEGYTSAIDRRILEMTPEDRKGLAQSREASVAELSTLVRLAEPGTQISAINNPATPDELVKRIADSGPVRLETTKTGAPSRVARLIQDAAKTELARRARKSKRAKNQA